MGYYLVVTFIALSALVKFEPAPFDIAALLVMAVLVIRGAMKHSAITFTVEIFYILLFSFFTCISLFQVINLSGSLAYIALDFYLITLFFIIRGLVLAGYQDAIIRGYGIAAYFTSVFAIIGQALNFMGYPNILVDYGFRAVVMFKDPNVMGAFLIPAVLWNIYKLIHNEKPLASFLALGLTLVGVLLSFSRGTLLALIITICIMIIFNRKSLLMQGWLNIYLLFLVGLVVITGVVYSFASDINLVMAFNRFTEPVQTTDTGRLVIYQRLPEFLTNSKFIGLGPDQFNLYTNIDPHNLYLKLLIEYGLGAAAAFIILFFSLVWKAFQIYKKEANTLAFILGLSLIAVLVQSLVVDTLHWRSLWIISGVISGVYLFRKDKMEVLDN